MNTTFDQLLHRANQSYFEGLYGLAGVFTELALNLGNPPATGLKTPKNSPPDTPIRPTPQQKRHALKQSHNPWGAVHQ